MEKLHIWTITSGQVALCTRLVVESLSAQERDRLLRELQAHLNQRFGIRESTLQLTAFNEGDRTSSPVQEQAVLRELQESL